MGMEERDGSLKDEVREHFELKKLKERLLRLEAENKELKMGNSILQTQYTSQCETQSDILRTLHSNLDDNYSKIEEQEKKIAELEMQLHNQEQDHKDEMEREKMQWKVKLDELAQKNADLQLQLDKERDFQRPALEAELASLKQQLIDQREQHRVEESALERKKAIDFDALRRDMEHKVERTREFLKLQTRDQLKTTTKRTIMENQQKATELAYQNSQTEKIMDQNRRLDEENAQLRRKIAIHKDLENELARRTHVYQKLIKKMEQKQRVDAATIEETFELKSIRDDTDSCTSRARSAGADGPSNAQAAQALAAATEESERLKRQLDGTTSNLQMVRNEFAQYRRDHATLTQLQDQSTRLIISALYELKNQRECDPFPPATYDENAKWQFVQMNPRQKEYFFRMLLERLNSSMCASCFPTGPGGAGGCGNSAASLPQIGAGEKPHGHSHGQGKNFSQFLWSVANTGGPQAAGAAQGGREMVTKGVQTETSPADPSLKEGLWNTQSRSRYSSSPASAAMVRDQVRSWGPRAQSHKPRIN